VTRILNPAQRAAVEHDEGHLLVLAGAGTGKTTVLSHRIARWLKQGERAPREVLALTFTNRAAREMRRRIEALAGALAPRNVGTFHAQCALLLRRFGDRPRFVIYDGADQLALLGQQSDAPRRDLRARLAQIEAWKNEGFVPEDAADRTLYDGYQRALQSAGAYDFADLLLEALALVRARPEICPWREVVVDEFQDSNRVQGALLGALAEAGARVTAVGDDDQSIYRWRGASVRNMLAFDQTFTDASIVRLEHNYRSVDTVLRAANAVIRQNSERLGKDLFGQQGPGRPHTLHLLENDRDEGEHVAAWAEGLVGAGEPAGEVAILVRINAQTRAIEDALRRRRIAYAVIGGLRFYDRKEVRDVLAYMRLCARPESDVDFLRAIAVPSRGIGAATLDALRAQAGSASLWQAAADFRGRARAKLVAFRAFIEGLAAFEPSTLLREVLERTGYLDTFDAAERWQREANIDALHAAIEDYEARAPSPTLIDFLETAALAGDADDATPAERVQILTLHAAKGMEFNHVMMPGMEDGLLPLRRAAAPPDVAEERRLTYVGMTRARHTLSFSACRRRRLFGRVNDVAPSPFLGEIPEDLLDFGAARSAHPPWGMELSGQSVYHRSFGVGRVLRCINGSDARLVIDFPGEGTKTVLAKYIERIG
jgi:DNA helicase-2/ATP-dependent DNA helicase PcrA